jgi:hypothetical protein
VNRDEIIYIEGKPAESLYLIYKGEFKLQKKNLSADDEIDKIELSRMKLYTVLKLGAGDLAGIETVMDHERYKYTLKVNINILIY